MYLKKLKIKDLELENNLILAPMAGVTDLPFRKICKEFGPGLVCTEMVSSKAIYHDDTKTKLLMNTDGEKRPISMQIFGSDEETMSYASKYVSKIADIVDINMGCPAPKVVKNGDGSKLLLDIEKAEKVIKAVVKNSTKPVTLKIRKGWDCNNIVAIEFAQMAEKAGVSAITIHGRTRTEMYSGKVDLDIIKKVKESVKIPVIGNGDIVDEESALKMFEYTGEYYFNGKPIYEKTIYINSLSNKAGMKDYNHKISNVDEIWFNTSKSFIKWKNLDGTPVAPFTYVRLTDNSAHISLFNLTNAKFSIEVGTNRSTLCAYVTINYTKTTDSNNGNTISPTSAN